MHALTMNDSSTKKKSTETSFYHEHGNEQVRISLGSLASKKSRCSVDNSGHGINFHDMMGISPRGPKARPPKLSFRTSLGNASVNNCMPAKDAVTSMNCVAT